MLVRGAGDQLVVELEGRCHCPGIGLPQPRRVFDVRQGEGHHTRRQLFDGGTWGRCLTGFRSIQRPVVGEYRPLQLAQTLARLDPELLDQLPARVLVGL